MKTFTTYRRLKRNEKLRKGDQYRLGTWVPVINFLGFRISDLPESVTNGNAFRRPTHWRALTKKDIVREGDQWRSLHSKRWRPAKLPGVPAGSYMFIRFRRKIESA